MSSVGDLGRRLADRRRQLGLATEEVANRAGMSPAYIRVLESSPSPAVSAAALWKLADALETSVDVISGSGMDAPPGRGDPSHRPDLGHLTIDECNALVAPGGVGRFVFVDQRGPAALPVNFRVLDGDIVFRTKAKAPFLADALRREISFEVDHLDEALAEGWSVLLTGEGHVIVDPAERDRARALGVAPWAGGEREAYVRLVPRMVTGRRIRRSGNG
jgi:transcriptional regulator with XRE-family HTH domain